MYENRIDNLKKQIIEYEKTISNLNGEIENITLGKKKNQNIKN